MKNFDYIIIGAGSAGCVIANRLSADPGTSVLLIEAGGKDKHPYIHIPGAYSKLHKSPQDWAFETTPQSHIKDRVIYIPRGKTLGGCTSTNAMAYVRGNKEDYNDWQKEGNEGWGFDDVLPYFKKSEHNEQANQLDQNYHSTNGELNVTFAQQFETPLADAFVAACDEYGIKQNKDYNGKNQTGSARFQFTIKNAKRCSAAAAFLTPILTRKNLKVITNTTVNRVLLKNDQAEGVETMSSGGITAQYLADKEVIISAGAFGSPQILNLSGIGAKDELTKHQIEIKHELAGVGKNLQDHLFCYIGGYTKEKIGVNHKIKLHHQVKDLVSYYFRKKGVLTCSPLESVAFFNIDDLSNQRANYQFHFAPLHFGKDVDAVDAYDISTFPTDQDGCMILPSLLKPESRGTVTLRSKDPFAKPIIDPRFLSQEKDLNVLLKGARIAMDVMRKAPLQKHINEHFLDYNISDAELIDHIKDCVETIYHPVGTCKMGHDAMSVVNHELKVHGIGKLRVADASIMPTITTGNTNAPAIMIGEKCADMILNGVTHKSASQTQVHA